MVERRRRDGGEEGGGMKHKVCPVYGGGGMGAGGPNTSPWRRPECNTRWSLTKWDKDHFVFHTVVLGSCVMQKMDKTVQ